MTEDILKKYLFIITCPFAILVGIVAIFLSLKIESSFRWIGIGIGVISILTGLSFIFLKPKQKVQNHTHPKKSEEVGGNVRKTCTHTASNVSSSSVGANSPRKKNETPYSAHPEKELLVEDNKNQEEKLE